MKNLAIFLFTFLVISADLKLTIHPHIHWVIWLLLIFPFIVKDILFKGIVKSPLFFFSIFTFLSGVLSSLIVVNSLETLIQATKFTLIFLTLYYFLYYNKKNWDPFYKAINFSVYINSFLLILGIIGIPVAQLLTGDGRWGTILAYPGSLVKIGILGLYVNVFSLILIKDKYRKTIMLVILSLFIIFMDGSRTGMLIIALTILLIPLLYFLLNYHNKIKAVIIPFILVTFMGLWLPIIIPYFLNTRVGQSINNLFSSNSIIQGLSNIDPARYMMFDTAIKKILDSPLIGTGAFSTRGIYEDGSSMVVHNTYLQIWGDYGLVGLVSYLLIILVWIFLLPKVLIKLQVSNDNLFKVRVCSSILVLVYFAFNGFFHPYSTELSEWILFIFPISIYFEFYKNKHIPELIH